MAVLLLQGFPEEAEGHGGLGGGAGLGDDVDGEVHIRHQIQHFLQRVGGQAVADEVDVGRILLFQVVVGGAQAVDDAPGAQVGPADADDHQGLGIGLNPGGGGLDAGKFLFIIVPGQMDPAGELGAGAGGVLQLVVGQLQPGSQSVLIGHGQEALHFKQFDIQHRVIVLSF